MKIVLESKSDVTYEGTLRSIQISGNYTEMTHCQYLIREIYFPLWISFDHPQRLALFTQCNNEISRGSMSASQKN
jgi:hypothetical protein